MMVKPFNKVQEKCRDEILLIVTVIGSALSGHFDTTRMAGKHVTLAVSPDKRPPFELKFSYLCKLNYADKLTGTGWLELIR